METIKSKNSSSNKSVGWRHVQTLLLLLGMTIGYCLRTCLSVAIVAMRNSTENSGFPQYDWDQPTSAIILGSFFWGYVITHLILLGYFTRTASAMNILAFGMCICSIANILIPWLANYGYVAVIGGRVVMGLGQGVLNPCTHTLMSRWIPPMERARLGSMILNGTPLGTIIGMYVSGILAGSRFGWPSIFYFFGVLGIIWSIVFYFFGADYPSEHSKIGFEEVQYINTSLNSFSSSQDDKLLKVPWKAILTSVPYWSFVIVGCGNTWGYYTFMTQLPTYLKFALHYDVEGSGTVSSLPYIAMWLMGFPISFLSDYALSKGAPLVVVRKICAVLGLWIPAACMIALATIQTTNTNIIIAILVVAIGFNCGSTCSTQINQIELGPSYVAPMTAFGSTITNIVSLGLPYLFKFVVTDANSVDQWQIVFFVTAGIYFFSNLIFLIFGKCEMQPWNKVD